MWGWLVEGFGNLAMPDYKRTTPSRNGGTPSGAAASKRAAAKRRNVRARSSRK